MKADTSFEYHLKKYPSQEYYKQISDNKYYHPLLVLRHHVKQETEHFFSNIMNATNVDLFMLTPSVSSPMGPGSDSEPIAIQFGELNTYLVDSSQFGFEPILLNEFDKLYCYLPSLRGEDPDQRHLNQFYHCEMEMKGTLKQLIPFANQYVKHLAKSMLNLNDIVSKISNDSDTTISYLQNIVENNFPEITFDDAVDVLLMHGHKDLINSTKDGRDISAKGEEMLLKILNPKTPIWVKYYDRDRVPFYQKPLKSDPSKVINADLLFPQVICNSFSGEALGAGQRQDNCTEMYESLQRQNVAAEPYQWYIDLRNHARYTTTSGFGMGIERLLANVLGKSDIKDVIPYPREKNILSYP